MEEAGQGDCHFLSLILLEKDQKKLLLMIFLSRTRNG